MLSSAGPSSPSSPGSARAFWWLAIAAGPLVALLVARAGFTWPQGDVARDLAWLTLVSVVEELVFRGGIQPALARWLGPDASGRPVARLSSANLLTSALFATMHLWRHPAALALAVFPVSLVYGKARELSGRWWPAAALHLWFNASLYAASWWLGPAR